MPRNRRMINRIPLRTGEPGAVR